MRYRVVAADLDGTLLGKDHRLSEFTKQTLILLNKQKILFIFATGRHHIDVKQIQKSLGIESFMITSNGARAHTLDGTPFFEQNLPITTVRDLLQLCANNEKIVANVYCETGWFVSCNFPELEQFHYYSNFHYQLLPKNLLTLERVCKLFYIGTTEELLQLESYINRHWGDQINASFSQLNCLEVMAGGVSKGATLEALLQHQGYTLQECIAFGDGMNDLEMLSMVGKGGIMKNGDQRLKQRLPDLEVIGDHHQDGVAHYLRRHLL